MKNARFWTWHNDGWVKLTLRPGQSLTHHVGGRTDEGWFSEATTWMHAVSEIVRENDSSGCDCDGPLYRHWRDRCCLDELAVVSHVKQSDDFERYPDGWMPDYAAPLTPAWESVSSSQRDVYAEAVGY